MDESFFDELIDQQNEKMSAFARKIIPNLTSDDLLQPCDFPQLENNAHFRYEEGILDGLRTAKMAFLASKREKENLF